MKILFFIIPWIMQFKLFLINSYIFTHKIEKFKLKEFILTRVNHQKFEEKCRLQIFLLIQEGIY